MKRSTKIVLGVLVALGLLAGVTGLAWRYRQQADRQVLVMGTEAGFKPFDYVEGGEIVGFDVDLAQEIADDLGYQLKVEDMAFDGLIAALQGRRVDIIAAAMTVTPERAKSINFSDPYYEASQMIIVHKDNSEITSKADLVGKRVGVQLGTTGDEMVGEIVDVVKVQMPAVPALLQDLAAGRLDAVVLDNAPAKEYLRNRPELMTLDEQLSTENYAIAIHKDDTELLESVNRTIQRIKSDGTYEDMMKKHFSGEVETGRATLKTIFLDDQRYMLLVNGLGITLALTAIAAILGIILGLLTAVFRISRLYPFKGLANAKSPWLQKLAKFNPLASLARLYTTVIRGTPVLVQLLIFYYVVFGPFRDMSKIIIAGVAFGLNSGAYVAEILRAGFESLPKGQWEAADSLGFSYVKTIRYITMPQVLKASLPSLMNEVVTLVKETSIVGWIGLADLMRGADNIRFQTATAFEALVAAALIYLLLTTILTRIATGVERRLKISD